MLNRYKIGYFQAPEPPSAAADGTEAPPAVVVPPIEPEPPAEPIVAEPDKPSPPKWALERISEETAKRQRESERAQAAERRASEAEAMLQRLQNGQQNPPAPPPAKTIDDAEIDRRATEKIFYNDTLAVRSAGFTKFGSGFEENLKVLGAVGALGNDFVADVIATDKSHAHEILAKLAQDPEKAVALVNMDSRARIAELTRMTMAAPAPITDPPANPKPAARVSRAPAPPPPVEPSASKITDWRSDEASDDDFSKGFDEMMKKRVARR